MHDELTAVDIKKMQEEIDYRKLVLAPQRSVIRFSPLLLGNFRLLDHLARLRQAHLLSTHHSRSQTPHLTASCSRRFTILSYWLSPFLA